MAFFDDLKDKVQELTKIGVEKSKQLGEIAKLKAANISEEENIKKAYIALGKLYYAERGQAPEAAYAALCEKITASRVNIEENKSRMEQLKAESGVNDFVEDVQEAGADLKANVVDPLAEKVKSTVSDVKTKMDDAADTADDAKDAVVETLEDAKDAVADTVEEVKETVDEIKE